MKFLRQAGFLSGWTRRSISWTCRGQPSGNITVEISTTGDHPYILFDYKVRRNGEEWRDVEYKTVLEKTQCRYGGFRWWFRCPNTKCNKRVRILYCHGDYFVCRKCSGLWYDSQKYIRPDLRLFDDMFKAEDMERDLRRRYYAGKPTRKYRRYLKLIRGMSFEEQMGMYRQLDELLIRS